MSSNSMERMRSLERGVTFLRLNHVLLPEPGKPTAWITEPLVARGRLAVAGEGVGETIASCAVSALSGPAMAVGCSGSGYAGRRGAICAPGTVVDLPPRPRRPRRRRRRPARCSLPASLVAVGSPLGDALETA